MALISWQQFEEVEIRVGRILEVEDFPEARKPAFKLKIDFGDFGIKRSSAQITKHYRKEQLVGKLVLAVTNFPPKQIGPFISEVLVTGIADEKGDVVLTTLDGEVPLGNRLF